MKPLSRFSNTSLGPWHSTRPEGMQNVSHRHGCPNFSRVPGRIIHSRKESDNVGPEQLQMRFNVYAVQSFSALLV